MIIVRLKGGLGNQMFQYAFGRCLAQLKDTELKLDRETYLARDPRRRYGLDAFYIDERFATADDMLGRPVISEKSLPYDGLLFDGSDSAILDGYWQSEQYFRFIRSLLREDFSLKWPVGAAARSAEWKIRAAENSAFMLVRRTDYVNSPVYVNLTLEYYERAAWYIARRVPDPNFFVFSDDPEWCRQNLKLSFPVTVLDPTTPHEDLWLMSLCRHAIIANSTFAWWGAWLGEKNSPERIVHCPAEWFLDPSLDSRDILPDRWVKMTAAQIAMEVKCFDYPLTPDSVVVDAGGHLGNWSAEIAHRYNPFIHIFEPVPEFAAALRQRFKSNPKITVHEVGLSDRDGTDRIAVNGMYSSQHNAVGPEQSIGLRDVAAMLEPLGAIDLVSLNIEGEEYSVLERMLATGTALRCRDIQVQFHYLADGAACERRRGAIRGALARSHRLTFDYPWIWENWQRQ